MTGIPAFRSLQESRQVELGEGERRRRFFYLRPHQTSKIVIVQPKWDPLKKLFESFFFSPFTEIRVLVGRRGPKPFISSHHCLWNFKMTVIMGEFPAAKCLVQLDEEPA